MKQLPTNIQAYKKTPIFTQKTIPDGLLKHHTTKAGTWGKICVLKGKLLYTIESEPIEKILLDTTKYGVVEPETSHFVEPQGEVEFYVEFFK